MATFVDNRRDRFEARVEKDKFGTTSGGVGAFADGHTNVGLFHSKNIFFKNAPLHDGAVVVENNRLIAAKCILPVTQSNVPKSYGTRHRAAIGLSEMTDAVVLVVSEETGSLSIVKGGKIKAKIDPQKLNSTLKQALEESDEAQTEAETN